MGHDLSHLSPVWGRVTDLIVERAEGCYVYTSSGERYLDFTSGIGVTNTGHAHPHIVKAIQQQASQFIHAQVNCYFHTTLIHLSQCLDAVTPPHLDTFFFSNSGAEAVEGAVKLAKHYTGRTNILVFQGSFHGRTALTMAMTTGKNVYRHDYQPLPSGIFVAPYPYAYRYGMDEESVSQWALRELDLIFHTQTDPAETAAVVIEPVLGEGGYVPAPASFLQALRRLCDEHGMLLVMDEIQSGFGRTGAFFAHQQAAVEADILIMAKGIASGLPLSCLASTKAIMERWKTGTHGGTFGGNPIACAAAIATLEVIEQEDLVANAAARGHQLIEGLKQLQKDFPVLGDVRGQGLMVGCEFTDAHGAPDPETMKKVMDHLLEHNHLITMSCGPYNNTIRLIPPLSVNAAQVDEALQAFAGAMAAAI